MLHTWRMILLVLAIVAAPQLAYVHTLSHLAQPSLDSAQEHRQQAPDKVCDTCLSIAQIGPAFGTQPAAAPIELSFALAERGTDVLVRQATPSPFHARAPPLSLIC